MSQFNYSRDSPRKQFGKWLEYLNQHFALAGWRGAGNLASNQNVLGRALTPRFSGWLTATAAF